MQKPMAENPLSPEEDITGYLFRHASEYIEREYEKPFFMWFSIPDPDELYHLASKPEHDEIVQEHRRYILDWMIWTQDAKRDNKCEV
jgi:hypothetical protein